MKKKIKHSVVSLCVLILIDIALTSLLLINMANRIDYYDQNVITMLQGQISNIVEKAFDYVEQAEIVVELGYDDISAFDRKTILAPVLKNDLVKNIVFAPNGIVKKVYPLKDNEKLIGYDFFSKDNLRHKIDAEIAFNLREPSVCGPYDLVGGGRGLFIHKAVFLNNHNGGNNFWGMISICIDQKKLFDYVDLEWLSQMNYEYKVTSNWLGHYKETIIESENYSDFNSSCIEVRLPNGEITLHIKRKLQVMHLIGIIFVFIISLFFVRARYKFLVNKENELENAQNEAVIDSLTGLYNRKKLKVFEEEFNKNNIDFAVFFIDLNYFKIINDTYGHHIGDKILVHLGNNLKKIITFEDLAIRTGGDEFIIILLGSSPYNRIEDFCEKLEDIQKEKTSFENHNIPLSLSYGYACSNESDRNFKEILELADTMMYKNKRNYKKTTNAD